MVRFKWIGLCLCVFLSIWTISAPDASQAVAVHCGDRLEGAYTGDVIAYQLDLNADQILIASLTATDFDAALALYDANGDRLMSDDDGGSDDNSLLIFAGSGRYELRVTNLNDDLTGTFVLALTCSSTCDALNADLTADGNYEYTFAAASADTSYVITVESDDFDPLVRLYDGEELLLEDDDGGEGLNSRLVAQVPRGTYHLEITSFFDDPSGAFALSICTEVTEEVWQPAIPDFHLMDLSCDSTQQGRLDDDSFLTVYQFQAPDDAQITLTMTATDGDLDSYVQWMNQAAIIGDEGGFVLRNDDRDDTDSRIEATVKQDETYYILASRFNLSAGESSGTFDLTLRCE